MTVVNYSSIFTYYVLNVLVLVPCHVLKYHHSVLKLPESV